ncbi:MAG TPA: hypothetical protein VEI03_03365 [Stellaceae bacterium]|nr:hypothetical protein [Stellaceae bacterium]
MPGDPREQRLTFRVLHYWRDRAGAGAFPLLRDIDLAALGEDSANCLLIKIAAPIERSSFLYVGRNLCGPEETRLEGRAVADCPPQTLLHRATSYLSRILEKAVPISLGGAITTPRSLILYRSILMPLTEDGSTVTAVFGAANSREILSSEEELVS